MSRPWFKFYTRDFRDGVRVLSLEEVGAYTLVLSLIYETGGKLKNDERAICAQIGCDLRVWRRVSQRLVCEGKIALTKDGFWTNERAQAEITSAELLAEKRRTSGRIGGELSGKSRAKPLKNKADTEASASTLLHTEYRRQSPDTQLASASCGGETVEIEVIPPDPKPTRSTPPALLPEQPVARAPERSTRKRAFTATDETMPREMTIRMVADAAEAGYVNGSGQEQFRRWRTNRIANGTKIACVESSFRTWLDRAPQFGMPPMRRAQPTLLDQGHDQQFTNRPADPGVRRRPRSALTEFAMRQIAGE